jgi:hypothetical protein
LPGVVITTVDGQPSPPFGEQPRDLVLVEHAQLAVVGVRLFAVTAMMIVAQSAAA